MLHVGAAPGRRSVNNAGQRAGEMLTFAEVIQATGYMSKVTPLWFTSQRWKDWGLVINFPMH